MKLARIKIGLLINSSVSVKDGIRRFKYLSMVEPRGQSHNPNLRDLCGLSVELGRRQRSPKVGTTEGTGRHRAKNANLRDLCGLCGESSPQATAAEDWNHGGHREHRAKVPTSVTL